MRLIIIDEIHNIRETNDESNITSIRGQRTIRFLAIDYDRFGHVPFLLPTTNEKAERRENI